MKARSLIMIAGAAAVLVSATWWAARPAPREWSTDSEEALSAFLAGREATQKLYFLEAIEHMRTALKHDEDFVAARLGLADALASAGQGDAARAERDRALEADASSLTPRERRGVELARLRRDGGQREVLALLEKSVQEFPGDPTLTRSLASMYYGRGDAEAAVAWFEKTLELAPNDGLSYNTLGYIEMGRGDFAAAEANLKRYAFIAPDQANPHDSLGELYTITGRWNEAIAEFRRALEVNPRFFPAWEHLARLHVLEGNEPAALEATERFCGLAGLGEAECEVRRAVMRAWVAWIRKDDAALTAEVEALRTAPGYNDVLMLRHFAALGAREFESAVEIEEKLEASLKKAGAEEKGPAQGALKELLVAARLVSSGDFATAVNSAAAADRLFNYNADGGQGVLKLIARALHVEALIASGRLSEARSVLASLEAVNPRFPGVNELRAGVRGR
ncbi:MAG: tetratricopeptide repeat protein [Acidobacteriota bacterium]